jgi:ribosomal protein S18 acetylase RimI-like enzyme
MLIEAVNFASDRAEDSADLLREPQVAEYLEGWPRERDRGFVAVDDNGLPLGASWRRYRTATNPGYGFLASDIPELTIAVSRDARGRGIGRALLRAVTDDARASGVTMLSLSVEHANHVAAHLYRREGWRTCKSDTDADTMVRYLTTRGRRQRIRTEFTSNTYRRRPISASTVVHDMPP